MRQAGEHPRSRRTETAGPVNRQLAGQTPGPEKPELPRRTLHSLVQAQHDATRRPRAARSWRTGMV